MQTPIANGKTSMENAKKIFQNNALNKKIRLLLWNAIIRSTMTYALQTREIYKQDLRKLEQFTSKCIRQIMEPYWYKGKHISKIQI